MTPATAPITAKVVFSQLRIDKVVEAHEFAMDKVGTIWKIAGNGQIAQTSAGSFARLQDVFVSGVLQTNHIDSGLAFEIKAPTSAGIAFVNATVPPAAGYYATVTGKGLPAAGALFVSDLSQTGRGFYAAAGAPASYAGNATPRLDNFGSNQIPLNDTAIAALLDNEIYTIRIFHDNATKAAGATGDDVLLATYTSGAGKRPYSTTELTAASFAAITAPTKAALSAFASTGGTISVTWTLPATILGEQSDELDYFRSGSTGLDSTFVSLAIGATGAPLTVAGPAAAGVGTVRSNGIGLFIADVFRRRLETIFNGG
jgi:hypothetical protein